MRILFVINGTDFGGTESSLAQIARLLDYRGHDVDIFSLKAPGRLGRKMIDSGMSVHTLGMDEVITPSNMLAAVVGLSRWLRSNPIDVVQSFLLRANIVSRIANRLTSRSRPHISSERSTDFNRSAWNCRLNRWTTCWTDRVLAISPEVKQVLLERDRVPESKIHILGNGLDLEQTDAISKIDLRGELGLSAHELVFCAVGRLVPVKGYSYLLTALASLEKGQRPHVVLVGEGPEEDSIKERACELGLVDHVHLLGFRDDAVGVMKDSDAYVLSSLQEGVPVVLLEAMASSLPVIATRVGGVPEIVKNGETGILVEPAEDWSADDVKRRSKKRQVEAVAALTEAMARLIEDPELRNRMGVAGRKRLEAIFSLESIVDRLESHFSELTGLN